ncbi:MAG TPA: hypothetical protein VMH90_05920, partial [Thermoplasmata archaeon]|nr:hypothetical protein [Thermoplasmata archaeon]
SGHAISLPLLTALSVYSVPMSYASSAFASLMGMIWTSLAKPWTGLSSPIGLVPFVGIAPSLLTLALVAFLAIQGFANVDLVVGAVVLGVLTLVVALLSELDRLLPRERLLSPV